MTLTIRKIFAIAIKLTKTKLIIYQRNITSRFKITPDLR